LLTTSAGVGSFGLYFLFGLFAGVLGTLGARL
jgi:hypothetical protein